jgi:hypothetical protein
MSAQSDRFVHDRLPPRAAWPQFLYPAGSPAGDRGFESGDRTAGQGLGPALGGCAAVSLGLTKH